MLASKHCRGAARAARRRLDRAHRKMREATSPFGRWVAERALAYEQTTVERIVGRFRVGPDKTWREPKTVLERLTAPR